jgi:hypothetical protein
MQLRYGLVFAANCAWAAATGLNYQLGDPTAVIAAMAVDAAGNTYLTGVTNSSAFPTTAGVFQPKFGGGHVPRAPASASRSLATTRSS